MKELLGFIVGFVLIYLLFAFGQASFNIAEWADRTRQDCAFFGFLSGVLSALGVSAFKDGHV